MKKPLPPVQQKAGQHEDQLAALARIEEALKKPLPPIKIEVRCSCCADTQKEILDIVKDIQRRIIENNDLANRATKEEVESILGPVLAKLKEVHT